MWGCDPAGCICCYRSCSDTFLSCSEVLGVMYCQYMGSCPAALPLLSLAAPLTMTLMVFLGKNAGGAAEFLVEPSVAGQLPIRLQRRTDGDSQSDVKLCHPVFRCGVQPVAACLRRASSARFGDAVECGPPTS